MKIQKLASYGATTILGLFLSACGGGGDGQAGASSLSAQEAMTQNVNQMYAVGTNGLEQRPPRVGLGIGSLSYWDRSFAMADMGRQSQARGLDWSYNVSVDGNGEPLQDFQLPYSATKIGAGTYKLSFSGRATLSAGGTGSVKNMIYDPKSNLTTADVVLPTDYSGNAWLVFKNTFRYSNSAAGSGISNIHFMRPGYAVSDRQGYAVNGTPLFTKGFIEAMQRVKIIRGMDFMNTNLNPQVSWSDRTKPNFFGSTGEKGQSWEVLIALANEANRDVWLNVPARADDDYIRKLAQLVKYGSDGVNPYTERRDNPTYAPLKDGLKVYVEYCNELWNSGPGFKCFRWALESANAKMGDVAHPIAFDGAMTDQYLALRRWIAYRSSAISLTFRDVFGDRAMMTTVRPILASQVGNGNLFLSIGLQWASNFYGKTRLGAPYNAVARDPKDLWYGGGGAAYYDSTINPTDVAPNTMSTYFANLPSTAFAASSTADSIWTHAYGLKYVAYEGGPGPGGSALGSVGAASISPVYNNDPRMKERMLLAQNIWDEAGGDELVYYVYSSSAPWSFTNELAQQVVSDNTSVKLSALDAINAIPKPVATLGSMVPAAIHLKDPASKTIGANNAPWALANTVYLLRPSDKNPYILLPIRTTEAGQYKIALKLGRQTTGQVALHANGVRIGDYSLVSDARSSNLLSAPLTAALPIGLSVLRLDLPRGSQDIFVEDVIVSK